MIGKIKAFFAEVWRRLFVATGPPPKRKSMIEFWDHDGNHVGRIVGVAGLYLDIRKAGGEAMEAKLISDAHCDKDEFWEQWKAWGGEELYFDDGERFDPTA